MPQIVSSAIANVPPPDALVDLLKVVGRAGHVNRHTAHKMVKTFQGGQRLLNERNWCEVWELDPRGQWAVAADTSGSSSSSSSSSGSSGEWGTAGHGRAVGNGQGPTKDKQEGDHTTAVADVANSRDQNRDQVMRGAAAHAQHATATATAPSPASQTDDAAGGTPGAATAGSAAAAGPHAAATSAQAGNTGQPVLQPQHRGEAEPGALVYALRLEHLTKRAESGAVLREYQVVVPRLERPGGMEDGVTDTQPCECGRRVCGAVVCIAVAGAVVVKYQALLLPRRGQSSYCFSMLGRIACSCTVPLCARVSGNAMVGVRRRDCGAM